MMMRLRFAASLFVVLVLAACGQVITPAPQQTVQPDVSPTATPIQTVTLRATFTPAPATPAASPTPTVTPTPIVYAIQPGDTLLVIAAQFGVSSEAIQEANGIVDPRRLQVGQQLIIPGPEVDPEDPPTPTPTPLPLTVDGLNFLRTPTDTLWVMGEIRNPGPDPVSEVVVEVTLLDENGDPLAAETGSPQLDVIRPGHAVAFAILFSRPPVQFAQYQALPLSGVLSSAATRYYLDLSVSDAEGQTKSADLYQVQGLLTNVGDQDAEQLRLLVTGYDEQNRVAAVRQAEMPAQLLRTGATTPFETELTMLGSPIITFSAQAQALSVE